MKKWMSFIPAFLIVFTVIMLTGLGSKTDEPQTGDRQNVLPLSWEVRSSQIEKEPEAEPTDEPKRNQFWYSGQVVVLTYHHVTTDTSKRYVISPESFAEHMTFLKENNLQPISLREFLRFVDTGMIAKENAVLLTFDDGYESYYREAYPILKEHGFPSVNFVIASRLRDSVERKRENMTMPLSMQQVEEMLASGLVEVGSHTYSLHDQAERNEWDELKAGTEPVFMEELNRLEDEEEYRNRLYVDFTMSRIALEELVKQPINVISLPHGYKNKIVLDTLQESGYQYAFHSDPAVVKPSVTSFGIPRYDVGLREVDVHKLEKIFTQAKTDE